MGTYIRSNKKWGYCFLRYDFDTDMETVNSRLVGARDPREQHRKISIIKPAL